MPREIKTTIAVDGEQAFKRAINEAQTSMRNLGTQLTLAQAQFKKDGDAMKLMETRSAALRGEIEQQEQIVTALEKAVKDSADAFGENSAKTEKWEAELNRAKAKLVNLQSELTLNDAGLDRNGQSFDNSSQKAADYQATLQTIGKNVSFDTVTGGIEKITGTVEGAMRKVFSFARAIRETFADAGEWADTLNTDATRYGMDVEELQRWNYAAGIIDTDVSTIITARDRLGNKMKNGWKDDGIDMWEMLGVDLRDAETGEWRNKMDVMWDLGETLMNMARIDGDDVRADAYAMQVFGKSWRDLLPLFTAGRDAWEEAMASAEVVSGDRVQALQELDDANHALENSWDVTRYSFLAELAPTITEVTEAVTGMLSAFNEWMDTDEGRQAMEDLSAAVKSLFEGLKDVSFKDAIGTVGTAINGIKEALIWLDEHKQDVVNALEVIAGGFGLLKLADLALNIGKIVSGLGGLAGAGGAAATETAGGGIMAGVKSAAGKIGGAGTAATVSGLTNIGFLADYFMHNTFAGRAVNPEYGNSFSLENLWNGFWEGVNDRIEDTLNSRAVIENAEGWSVLHPGSRERYEARQAQEAYNAEARAWYAENSGPAQTEMTPERWESMSRTDRRLYMDTHPLASQEEINQQYLNSGATLTQGPGAGGDIGALLSQAVAEIKTNVETGTRMAEKVDGMDLRRFNGLPAEIQAAAQRGTANGVSGIRVLLDGEAVGRLIAPIVNAMIGQGAQ